MRHLYGNFLSHQTTHGSKGNKMKNHSSSFECKCFPPLVNVHHYKCPLVKTPCPVHGNPFVYNIKSKKASLDECMVISFHPSLKTDKLFGPVKTFLAQTCEPGTKVNFQCYSSRQSETRCEELKNRQIQTNPDDFKKMMNDYFVKKTKTFFSDKTNKMKKLKQCFNSPCNSVVYKSRSCTAIKEKINQIFREDGGKRDMFDSGNRYLDKSEKRMEEDMKSEQSSHFLYRRNLDLSDGEKSTDKEKIDSDFITLSQKINNDIKDHTIFEEPYMELGRGFTSMEPHFMYPTLVRRNRGQAQGQSQTRKVSDVETSKEPSKKENAHNREPQEESDKVDLEGSDVEKVSSESSGSVYFTPFILFPRRSNLEVDEKGVQTDIAENEMSSQLIQTTDEPSGNANNVKVFKDKEVQTEDVTRQDEGLRAMEPETEKTPDTSEPEEKFLEQTIPDKETQTIPDKETQTIPTVVYQEPNMKFLKREKSPKKKKKGKKDEEPKSAEVQTEKDSSLKTLVYYEPEMKFLERQKTPDTETKAVEAETQTLPTVVYYEPDMKFLKREKSPKKKRKGKKDEKAKSAEVQTEKDSSLRTLVYYEPEMKFLERQPTSQKETKGVEAEAQTIPTVVYHEPDMKFLRRETIPEKETKAEEAAAQTVPTVVYQEPEMKFHERQTVPEKETKAVETETQTTPPVVYQEPERKFPEKETKAVEAETQTVPTVVCHESETKCPETQTVPEKETKAVEAETQTIPTVVCHEPETKCPETQTVPEKQRKGVETETQTTPPVVYEEPERKLPETQTVSEKETKAVEAETQTIIPTVVYHEPEMNFLKRQKSPKIKKKGKKDLEAKSAEAQNQKDSNPKTLIYYEPEMKFPEKQTKAVESVSQPTQTDDNQEPETKLLKREISPENMKEDEEVEQTKGAEVPTETQRKDEPLENVTEVKEQRSSIVQTELVLEPVTVIYFEPETKPLKKREDKAKRGVAFDFPSETDKDTNKKDDLLRTEGEPETKQNNLQKSLPVSLALNNSQDKGVQANYDSDTSQSSYMESCESNMTYVIRSYNSEDSDQMVAKNWNKSRSDGEMIEKKKCICCRKPDKTSLPPAGYQNQTTYIGVYSSNKSPCGTTNLVTTTENTPKTQKQSKSEKTGKKNKNSSSNNNNNNNNTSVADLSDLIRIIDENFKRMFNQTIEMCECRYAKEKKVLADKEVITEISEITEVEKLLKTPTTRINTHVQTNPPAKGESSQNQDPNRKEVVPLNENEEVVFSICSVCSKARTQVKSVGTNTGEKDNVSTKTQNFDVATPFAGFQEESIKKSPHMIPKSEENPSTPEGKPGKEENPSTPEGKPGKEENPSTPEGKPGEEENPSKPEGKPGEEENPSTPEGKPGEEENRRQTSGTILKKKFGRIQTAKTPDKTSQSVTSRKTFVNSFDSSSSSRPSLQDSPNPQLECSDKPTKSKPSNNRSPPTPKPRQTINQVKPEEPVPNIPCRSSIPIRKKEQQQGQGTTYIFETSPTIWDDIKDICPLLMQKKTSPDVEQPTKHPPKKDLRSKQNHMTYHVTLAPLWSTDLMRIFQKKLKQISKSECLTSLNDSSASSRDKQKRSHDGNDDGPLGKKIKSCESEEATADIFDTDPMTKANTDFFEFGKSQTDIIFNFLLDGETFQDEDSPQLTKDTGFVWVPSFSTPHLFSIRKISSAVKRAKSVKSEETFKEFRERHSQTLSKIMRRSGFNNLFVTDSYQQKKAKHLDHINDIKLIKKLFNSSCKCLNYSQINDPQVVDKHQNNSSSHFPNSSLENAFMSDSRSLVLTPRSYSLIDKNSWNTACDNSFSTGEHLSKINSEEIKVEEFDSAESNIPSSSTTEQGKKFFQDFCSKLSTEKSDPNAEVKSSQVKTCSKSEFHLLESNKPFNHSCLNQFSFHDFSPQTSKSDGANKLESFSTFQFSAESSSSTPDSRKLIFKNFPTKPFRVSKKKVKEEDSEGSGKED